MGDRVPPPALSEMICRLRSEPANHRLADEIGTVFERRGEHQKGVPYVQQAMQRASGKDVARYSFHVAQLILQGNPIAAIPFLEKASELDPNWSEPFRALAYLYREQLKRDDLAFECFVQAVRADRTDPEPYIQICRMLGSARNPDEIAADLSTCVGFSPEELMVRTAVATGLEWLGREREAVEIWEKALALHPNDRDTVFGLARSHLRLGNMESAAGYFERAIALAPNFPPIVFNYIKFLLRIERWEGATKVLMALQRRSALEEGTPIWDGTDISGRSFLLNACHAGHGDAIQFVRLATVLRNAGARSVTVECESRLCDMLGSVDGVDRAIPYREECVFADYNENLIDGFLKIPHYLWYGEVHPYMAVPESNREWWRKRIPRREELNVGLVWACRDIYGRGISGRSMPLEALAPLLRLPGVCYYSLQRNPGAQELQQSGFGKQLVDLADEVDDYLKTAAAMLALDLIVSVDTSAAHLAGAVNQRAAVVLPYHADWRWEEARERSPWYPSLRLFRAPEPLDWTKVVEQVRKFIVSLRCSFRLNADCNT